LQDERLVGSSPSPESQVEDSGSEASTDDVNMDAKGNGFHDAENDVDQDMDDDNGAERILSGKLSESSGYAGSDLYDCKVLLCSLLFKIDICNYSCCYTVIMATHIHTILY
jgi:hypothetical protein